MDDNLELASSNIPMKSGHRSLDFLLGTFGECNPLCFPMRGQYPARDDRDHIPRSLTHVELGDLATSHKHHIQGARMNMILRLRIQVRNQGPDNCSKALPPGSPSLLLLGSFSARRQGSL